MNKTPFDLIKNKLKQQIPEYLIENIPKKWELNGDIVILKINNELITYKKIIGKIYANALSCKTSLMDKSGITGEFRKPNNEIIWGNENTETIHVENKIRYCFDPMKIMFSSGNINERIRMAKISNKQEIIVDLFAGIGYFCLPIAVFSKPKKIYACEKNKESYNFLSKNIVLNHATEIIKPIIGDNRKTAPQNVADQVLMGYFKNTKEFINTAIKCLKNNTGIIHYHNIFSDEKIPEIALNQIEEKAKEFDRKIKLIRYIKIKTYAPGISHYVFDVKIIK